jgi:Helicase conserved C-terminal domain
MAASKEATLLALAASAYSNGRTIVFFRTKVAAHRAKLLFGLEKLPPAAELHGNMSQTGRLEALDAFRKVPPTRKTTCHAVMSRVSMSDGPDYTAAQCAVCCLAGRGCIPAGDRRGRPWVGHLRRGKCYQL